MKWKTLKIRQCIPTMFLRWLAFKSNQTFCYIIGSCTLHFDVYSHDSDRSLRSILIKFSTHVICHKISVKWANLLKPFQIGGNVVILKERYVLRAYYFLNQSHLTISSKNYTNLTILVLFVYIHMIEKWLAKKLLSILFKIIRPTTGTTETQYFQTDPNFLEKHYRRDKTCCLEKF